VTERCDMDLKEFLQSQPQCVGERDYETWHSLMRQVSGGMAFLHDNNIIHRDLKPGNVLCNFGGEVRICDFGLSVRTRLKELDETHTGYAGTPLYMAPEMMQMEGVRYSSKVDVFSFGVLMCQCWTGKQPYDEIKGPLWRVQKHILDGGRPLWKYDEQRDSDAGAQPNPQSSSAVNSALSAVAEMGLVEDSNDDDDDDGNDDDDDDDDDDDEQEKLRQKALQVAVVTLAARCWAENPDERPSFHEISKVLEEMEEMTEEGSC